MTGLANQSSVAWIGSTIGTCKETIRPTGRHDYQAHQSGRRSQRVNTQWRRSYNADADQHPAIAPHYDIWLDLLDLLDLSHFALMEHGHRPNVAILICLAQSPVHPPVMFSLSPFRLYIRSDPGAALEIFDWGSKVRGSGGRKSPGGVQGQSPASGGQSPQNLKHFWKVGINFYKKNNWNRLLLEKK